MNAHLLLPIFITNHPKLPEFNIKINKYNKPLHCPDIFPNSNLKTKILNQIQEQQIVTR